MDDGQNLIDTTLSFDWESGSPTPVELDWGTGAQDFITPSSELEFQAGQSFPASSFGPGQSLSDRLRGIAGEQEVAAAAGTPITVSQAANIAVGGAPFTGLTADPVIDTGSVDFSSIFRVVRDLAGFGVQLSRGFSDLAGVRAGAPAGNPAPGGRRMQPALFGISPNLLLLGAVGGGAAWLIFRRRRA